jgi:radical SAM/Cys-rich protein
MASELSTHIDMPQSDFERIAESACPGAHRVEELATVMVNVGLHCNLSCELCHLSCSPEHTEMMSRGTMLEVLHFAAEVRPQLLDVTGGEPTLWPLLREFVQLSHDFTRVRVRTNLDALLLPEAAGVMQTLAENGVEILASLPEALEGRTIGGCIEALSRLMAMGYGNPRAGAAIPLDLAYNPLPGELPRDEGDLEDEFRAGLAPHGIHFRSLVAITNFPLGGFAQWLDENNEQESYRSKLRAGFNQATLPYLTCRHGIEIAWDGTMWDCDFNLAARLPLSEKPRHVGAYVGSPAGQMALTTRRISFGEHCFACAAGVGSGPNGSLL